MEAAAPGSPSTHSPRSLAAPATALAERGAAIAATSGSPSSDQTLEPAAPAEGATAEAQAAGQARDKPAPAAESDLLRAPTNVAHIADDFFAGLIRRVEGDP
jgi:hypothetical protein